MYTYTYLLTNAATSPMRLPIFMASSYMVEGGKTDDFGSGNVTVM